MQAWDQTSSRWLQGPAEFALTVVGAVTQQLFSGQVVLGVALIAAVLLLLRRRWLLAASMAAVFPLVLAEVALKLLIQQPPASRYLQLRLLFSSYGPPGALATGFPSGHAARAMFVIGWLTVVFTPNRYRPLALAGAIVLTLFVCWTRIYVGDHSVLEIVAGLVLAVVFLVPAGVLSLLARRADNGGERLRLERGAAN